MNATLSPKSLEIIKTMQQNELTESVIYAKIATFAKGEENKKTLLRLSQEEHAHYEIWKKYTGIEMKPEKAKVLKYTLMARILGFTFAVKLMERGEEYAQNEYEMLAGEVPESTHIRQQEEEHENALLEMLDEERLQYVGSMVLGLNDALVELTGSLAGFAFALQNTRLIALSGLIVGISATFSMASSEFLAARSEGRSDALKSCSYTGIAYLLTVVALIAPYLLLHRYCLPADRYRSDSALSDLPRHPVHPRTAVHAGCGYSDHRRLYLLHLHCPGRALQVPFPGNGNHQRQRRRHVLRCRCPGKEVPGC